MEKLKPQDYRVTKNRVFARTLAEELGRVNGSALEKKLSDDTPDPTISEAATSESIPDR